MLNSRTYRNFSFEAFIPYHNTATRFIRLAFLIWKVKLHKPIVVELLRHRL